MYFILRFIVIKVENLQNTMGTKTLKLLNFVEIIKKLGNKEKEFHARFCFVHYISLHGILSFLDVRSCVKAHNNLLINVVIVSLNTCFST